MEENKRTANRKKRLLKIEHWHVVSLGLVIYDFVAVILAYFLALWFRFDCTFSAIPDLYFDPYKQFIVIYAVIALIVFWRCRLYNSIWRFASYDELLRMVVATAVSFGLHCLLITLFWHRMPLSYYFFGGSLQFALTLVIRFSYRFVCLERSRRAKSEELARANRVMLIGAGSAGQLLLRDIRAAKTVTDVVECIIDDNPNKWGRLMDGVPIVGGREKILYSAKKYRINKIFLAIPRASAEQRREILDICKETGCELRNLPGMFQLYNGEVTVSRMREVSVEDLLGRESVKVNLDEIFRYLKGKTCLITGGGGSIGSELARQIAAHEPKRLVLFDVYENSTYDIQNELKKKYPNLDLVVIIGSVRDSRKIFQVFADYRPEVVYHAAAHKHVPLMEESPCESIKNNTIGTYKTAFAAMVHGCERFVLISTDKAVNPTNIMGASKRLCEMVIQSFDYMVKAGRAHELPQLFTHSWVMDSQAAAELEEKIKAAGTEFVAVRFGNVLGSNGSVIPLFKKQIAEGGPVTVTHPDIIRYFMTIPEAVSLVLQAGTYAGGGEIFVLDMGEPVKIDTLARNLIKLSGHKPDEDIKIEYTGLRPGEKLFEEKLMAEEGLKKTENELIFIGQPIPFDIEVFLKQLDSLMDAAYKNKADIRERVQEMVPTYRPAENSEERK